MSKRRKVVVVDLFAGGGGAGNGAKAGLEMLNLFAARLVAVNHWPDAMATYLANHPEAVPYRCAVEEVNPREAVPGGYVDILMAGPSCTEHSNAKGGRARDNQSRTSPWSILNWLKELYVRAVIIENVPEFRDWGPLDQKGKRIKQLKGKTFIAYIEAIKAMGYKVEYRVINSADYGAETARRRLFILARRIGTGPIEWPEPTHIKPAPRAKAKAITPVRQLAFFPSEPKPAWRVANDIIDWSIPMGEDTSVFNRHLYGKRPLAEKTMRRILIGFYRHGLRDFVIGQQSAAAPRPTDEPIPSPAGAGAISLVRSFLLPNEGFYGGNAAHPLDEPIGAITQRGGGGLVHPWLVHMRGTSDAADINMPVPTIAATGPHFYLAQPLPFLTEFHGGDGGDQRSQPLDVPIPVIDTSNRFGLVHPWLVQWDQTGSDAGIHSLSEPLRTIVSKQNTGLVYPQPYIVDGEHGDGGGRGNESRTRPIDSTLPVISGSATFGLAQPYLIKFNGTGIAQGLDEPLGTLTSKERFALCVPLPSGELYFDIRFRMLVWRELAAAMGFPRSYIWMQVGKAPDTTRPATVKVITKLIGNAWENRTGKHLFAAQIKPRQGLPHADYTRLQ